MANPTQFEMENNIMIGKGDFGIKKTPTGPVPLQSQSATRTSDGKKNFDVKKKMADVMKKIMKGC